MLDKKFHPEKSVNMCFQYQLKTGKQKKARARARALAAVNPSSHSLVLLKASLSSINNEIKAKLNSEYEISEIKAIAEIKKKFSKLKCKVGPLKNQAGQFISDPWRCLVEIAMI